MLEVGPPKVEALGCQGLQHNALECVGVCFVADVEANGVIRRDESHWSAEGYTLSFKQVEDILDLKLYQLTGLEKDRILAEYLEIIGNIKELLDILANEYRVLAIITDELMAIRNKYATPRLTDIVPDEGEIRIEDLIANESCVITITHGGNIKRTASSEYRAQKRGGRGVMGMTTKDGNDDEEADFVEHLFTATTHDYLMFFSEGGKCFVERVHQIPEGNRTSKGRSIANLLELLPGDSIATTLRIIGRQQDGNDITWTSGSVIFATQKGIVKKTALSDFANVRKGGIIGIQIEEGDRLIAAEFGAGENEIILVTSEGGSIRFHENEMRSQGRNTVGVWGIKLEEGDKVVSMTLVDPGATLLVVGETGIGKRTPFEEYRQQSRGGKGIITMKTGEKTGKVVGAVSVRDTDDLVLITDGGQMVRLRAKDVREAGRNTAGVKLINLKEGEKLQDIAAVPVGDDEIAAAEPGSEPAAEMPAEVAPVPLETPAVPVPE